MKTTLLPKWCTPNDASDNDIPDGVNDGNFDGDNDNDLDDNDNSDNNGNN